MSGQDSATGAELWRTNIRRLTRAAVIANGVGGLLVFLLLAFLIPFAPEGAQDDIPFNAAVGAAYLAIALGLGARWGMRASGRSRAGSSRVGRRPPRSAGSRSASRSASPRSQVSSGRSRPSSSRC